jgi:hypothetical protein
MKKRKRRKVGHYEKKTRNEDRAEKEKQLKRRFLQIYGKEPTGNEFEKYKEWFNNNKSKKHELE